MATGKNKLTRYARLYAGGYDLSGDARTFSALQCGYDSVDMTGWSNDAKNYLANGGRMVGVEGFQALANDASTGSYTALNAAGKSIVASVFLGGGAAPTYGDIAYLVSSVQMDAPMSWDGGAAAITASFMPSGAAYSASADMPLGVVLYPLTSISATTNGAIVDNGAASSLGAHANLHITATSSGNFAITVQASTTGSFAGEETTLMTFSITGSAINAERQTATGTVPRYLRLRAVRTAGTISLVCGLARN
jgi:hypothetical protein